MYRLVADFPGKVFKVSLEKKTFHIVFFRIHILLAFWIQNLVLYLVFFPANILGIQVHLFMIKSFFCKKRSFFSIDRNTLSENEIPHQAILINLNKYNDRLIFQCFSETIVSLNMISKWP